MPVGGITLVCMPFGHAFAPSIGLGLLKASLSARGIDSRIRYLSIRFAETIGRTLYGSLSGDTQPSIEDLVGEWIFSGALFGPDAPREDYVEDVLRRARRWTTHEAARPAPARLIQRILRARGRVDAFLQECLRDVVRDRPRVVGFTSMFQQHVASLALARMVKQALPETFIVFGGANCEDVMGAETVRQFPFVDAAVSGEGDVVFPELVRRVLAGQPVSGLAGVRTRERLDAEFASGRFSPAPMVGALDTLPFPDYRDYFQQFQASRFGAAWRPRISFETSRGCWWGERMHCTFCGLNGQRMTFRSKSADRVVAELDWLCKRHRGSAIDLTDSILDMAYFKDVIPALAARPRPANLFYEVKANLNKRQLLMLRDAGIRSIQPGVESFSDAVLKLMRKGVSALQNIQLLKWCKELEIEPSWNLIWGFPGEPPEEYERMAGLIRLLTHLPPPDGHAMLRLDRFSPNFDDAERLGFTEVKPVPAYRYVYPFAEEALANLAYFFAFQYREPRDVRSYVGRFARAVRDWRRAGAKYDVFSVDLGECLLIWDLRPGSRTPLTVLEGTDRLLYQACDSASDARRLVAAVPAATGPLPCGAIADRLGPLVDRGLVVTDGSRYLALAIPLGEYAPSPPAVAAFYEAARTLGTPVRGGWTIPWEAAANAGGPRKTLPARQRRAPPRGPRRGIRLTTSHFAVGAGRDVLVRQMVRRGAD